METPSDFISLMMKNSSEMMNQWLKSSTEISQSMNAFMAAAKKSSETDDHADEVIQRFFQYAWKFHQEYIGKYLKSPKLGLFRENLREMAEFTDAYNKFIGSSGEFLQKFKAPFKESLEIFQTRIRDEAINTEDSDALYNLAVRTLREKYDAFLKSPEGVNSLMDMLDNYLTYKQKQNVVTEMTLRPLSVPTKKEMEEIYREIYLLKKKTREQDAVIRKQEKMIASLTETSKGDTKDERKCGHHHP